MVKEFPPPGHLLPQSISESATVHGEQGAPGVSGISDAGVQDAPAQGEVREAGRQGPWISMSHVFGYFCPSSPALLF